MRGHRSEKQTTISVTAVLPDAGVGSLCAVALWGFLNLIIHWANGCGPCSAGYQRQDIMEVGCERL
jgi:hypothetical protein